MSPSGGGAPQFLPCCRPGQDLSRSRRGTTPQAGLATRRASPTCNHAYRPHAFSQAWRAEGVSPRPSRHGSYTPPPGSTLNHHTGLEVLITPRMAPIIHTESWYMQCGKRCFHPNLTIHPPAHERVSHCPILRSIHSGSGRVGNSPFHYSG